MRLPKLRAELVEALRRMQRAGLVLGAAGNASARDPDSALVVVSPTSLPYEDMRPEDVAVLTADGELVEGGKPSVEAPLHLVLLRGLADAGAVVHTHSPYATALACVLDELPVVAPEQAAAVGGATPVVPYVPTGTQRAGEQLLATLQSRWAVVIRNHGPVCLGRDLSEALACAFAVEESARIYTLARLSGVPALLPDGEVERVARLTGRRR